MKTIIGLSGVKRSGKNTIAEIIREEVDAREVAIADKLKHACMRAFELSHDHFFTQELKEKEFKNPIYITKKHMTDILNYFEVEIDYEIDFFIKQHFIGVELSTPRKILQVIGCDFLRGLDGFNNTFHCERMYLPETNINIITDIRYPDEHEYFNNLKGYKYLPLYVSRDFAEKEVEDHRSEKLVLTFADKCIKVDNNGTLEETKKYIKKILKENNFTS